MRAVEPEEILPLSAYDVWRPVVREGIQVVKRARRVHLGEHLTFLFENADTVRYQVQEMLRVERREKLEEVLHEVRTYNELLGGPGELGCTLLIELTDPAERDVRLREWLSLPRHLFAVLEGGERIGATFDERQVGDDRLSSVQYLCFPVRGEVPVALACDLPGFDVEVRLDEVTREALKADLSTG
jgi:hypothetical protein